MGTLTKAERKALDELFLSIHEKRNFFIYLRNSKKEMLKALKFIIKTQKIQTKHL
jgi:hypothetical protein